MTANKKYRHRAALLIRDDKGRLLVKKSPPERVAKGISIISTPGGGVHENESESRYPTEKEIIQAARREALEELGIRLKRPKVVGKHEGDLEEWWKDEQEKKRGVRFDGMAEHYVLASPGKRDMRFYNVEGDKFKGRFYTRKHLDPLMVRDAKRKAQFAQFNQKQLEIIRGLDKKAAVAVKRDPAKWEAAKRQAKAKMGGKHSARAMQLATQIYKRNGGTYAGKKPSASTNKLKKWTKQKWKWSGGDSKGQGGKGVYLPSRASSALKSTKAGRAKLQRAADAKRRATREGIQFSRHGLHVGKNRSEVKTASAYRDRVEVHAIQNIEGKPHILASIGSDGIAFPGGGIERGGAIGSAKREMLEEAGFKIKSPRLVSKGQKYTMSDKWQAESLHKRGKSYKGVNNHIVQAKLDGKDNKLLNIEGDQMRGLRLIPLEDAHFMLKRQERLAEFDADDAWSRRATKSRIALEGLMRKTASSELLELLLDNNDY